MSVIKKIFYISLAVTLIFWGVWLAVMNDQALSLNLFFAITPPANAGLVIFAGFALGALCGFIVGFNLLELLKLNNRLYWLKREVRQLQDALGDKR